jgi:hypothetical protein
MQTVNQNRSLLALGSVSAAQQQIDAVRGEGATARLRVGNVIWRMAVCQGWKTVIHSEYTKSKTIYDVFLLHRPICLISITWHHTSNTCRSTAPAKSMFISLQSFAEFASLQTEVAYRISAASRCPFHGILLLKMTIFLGARNRTPHHVISFPLFAYQIIGARENRRIGLLMACKILVLYD